MPRSRFSKVTSSHCSWCVIYQHVWQCGLFWPHCQTCCLQGNVLVGGHQQLDRGSVPRRLIGEGLLRGCLLTRLGDDGLGSRCSSYSSCASFSSVSVISVSRSLMQRSLNMAASGLYNFGWQTCPQRQCFRQAPWRNQTRPLPTNQ